MPNIARRAKDLQMRKKKPVSKANTYGIDPEVDLGVKVGADDQPDKGAKPAKRPSKGKKLPKVVPPASTASSAKPKKVVELSTMFLCMIVRK